MVTLAVLPGMLRTSLMVADLANPGNSSRMINLLVSQPGIVGLGYVWGGGPLRGHDACGDLAYFPRFFERPPAFFPENRSDNINLRLAGIIGICP